VYGTQDTGRPVVRIEVGAPLGAAALASKGKRLRDVDRQIARAEVALQAL
jgi:hypothetical protein